MGHAPARRNAPRPTGLPTRLEVARARYVGGAIELDDFEAHVEHLLRAGTADDPAPPPKPSDVRRSVGKPENR